MGLNCETAEGRAHDGVKERGSGHWILRAHGPGGYSEPALGEVISAPPGLKVHKPDIMCGRAMLSIWGI